MIVSKNTIAEYAAQQCENAAKLLQVEAIASVIADDGQVSGKDIQKAEALVEGLTPLFSVLAQNIRTMVAALPEIPLFERDKQIVDLTIEQAREGIFQLIRNPAKKPRVSGETVRKGVWWEDVSRVLDGLKQNSKTLDDASNAAREEGYKLGVRQAAERVQSVPGYVRDETSGPRSRKPEEYAEEVRKLIE